MKKKLESSKKPKGAESNTWSFIETSRAKLDKSKHQGSTKADKDKVKESQGDNLSEAEPDVNRVIPK